MKHLIFFLCMISAITVSAQDPATYNGYYLYDLTPDYDDSVNFATQNMWWSGLNGYYRFSEDGVKYSLKSYIAAFAPSAPTITASNGLTKVSNDIQLGGTLTASTTINVSSFPITFSGDQNEGINITSSADDPALMFNSAASGNNRNWKIAGDATETYRGLTFYRSTTAGGSPTTNVAKFTDNGSFVMGTDFNSSHMIYWQPKNALRIGITGGGDYAVQNYDFIQGNNVQNQGTGTDNILKGQAYGLTGVSKGNIINAEGLVSTGGGMSDVKYSLIMEGGLSPNYRNIGGSILIGSNNTYNASGTTFQTLYSIQIGNHNIANATHHLFQLGTGLRNTYGSATWGDWTFQPKFYFGTANVQYTTAANKAAFVIANGLLNNGSHSDPSTYHSHSFTHFNNGWTQINTINNGFLTGGTDLSESDVTPKAALEVVSTTSGILFPRLTTTQFGAIPGGNLVDGMVVYESDVDKFKFRQGGGWSELGSGGWAITGTTTLTGNVDIDADGNDVTIGTATGPQLGILSNQVFLTKGDPNSYGFSLGTTDQAFVTGDEVHLQGDGGNESLELSATNGLNIASSSTSGVTVGSGGTINLTAANEIYLTATNDMILGSSAGGVVLNATNGILLNGTTVVDIGADKVSLSGSIAYVSIISPAALTTNTDNYAPTNGERAAIFRISSTGVVDLTGISVSQIQGQEITLMNVGANNIVLKNNVTSTAANRFLFSLGDFTLLPEAVIKIIYDNTSARWRKLD